MLGSEHWHKPTQGNHHFGLNGKLLHGLIYLQAHLVYHFGQVNYLESELLLTVHLKPIIFDKFAE
jgi:hypothetical protein